MKIAVCGYMGSGKSTVSQLLAEKLKLDFGSTVSVRQHTCPTGSKIYLKPEETAFVQLDDPKTILEESINKHYPVLSTDDDIYILYTHL